MAMDVVSEYEVVLDRARCPVVARDDNRTLLALALEAVSNRDALASRTDEMVQHRTG